ncbi:type II toxin-antitoxin system RelE/ParE family toxin [Myroides odoratimimus]|uniref:Uncharacterized protein n=2 Tax=Myroides odoratimimus TaxID=76832 RepID=A0A0S7EJ58_9FLAO|nr:MULTISPECIES: type II toxin-antitoxin system RelE/ParE family toxin [Myroides]OJR86694.1 hypothetical protein BK387_28145 [Escherichia coli]ALU27015.1 hypothetical protein AS202_13025 [Myroides odoratimimus]EHO08644.1 hypothetical protein HMPREF9712_02306 [Myroides odoratimimus CCUG 10230]EKB06978.1 hypothetical protein HMPREF9711_00288 [Myroides odoratimimus CCUG 3837]MCA4793191.1 type II toxin-antitoxin system RelE/ParE family toxin [Myroides odoratimimus]
MYILVNNSLVEQDIRFAFDYYKSISHKLAKEFIQQLQKAKENIILYPFSNYIVYNNVRLHKLKQFPYHIHYIVEEDKMKIIILAIVHTKREYSKYK